MWSYFAKAAQGVASTLQEAVGFEEEVSPESQIKREQNEDRNPYANSAEEDDANHGAHHQALSGFVNDPHHVHEAYPQTNATDRSSDAAPSMPMRTNGGPSLPPPPIFKSVVGGKSTEATTNTTTQQGLEVSTHPAAISSGGLSASASRKPHGGSSSRRSSVNNGSSTTGLGVREALFNADTKAKVKAIGKGWLGAVANFVKTVQNDLGAHGLGSSAGQFLRELEMDSVMSQMDHRELYEYLVDIVDRVEAFGEEIAAESKRYRFEMGIEEQVSLTPTMRECYDDWELGVNKSLSKAHQLVTVKVLAVNERASQQAKSDGSVSNEDGSPSEETAENPTKCADSEDERDAGSLLSLPLSLRTSAGNSNSSLQQRARPLLTEEELLMWQLFQKRILVVRDQTLDTMMAFLEMVQLLEQDRIEDVIAYNERALTNKRAQALLAMEDEARRNPTFAAEMKRQAQAEVQTEIDQLINVHEVTVRCEIIDMWEFDMDRIEHAYAQQLAMLQQLAEEEAAQLAEVFQLKQEALEEDRKAELSEIVKATKAEFKLIREHFLTEHQALYHQEAMHQAVIQQQARIAHMLDALQNKDEPHQRKRITEQEDSDFFSWNDHFTEKRDMLIADMTEKEEIAMQEAELIAAEEYAAQQDALLRLAAKEEEARRVEEAERIAAEEEEARRVEEAERIAAEEEEARRVEEAERIAAEEEEARRVEEAERIAAEQLRVHRDPMMGVSTNIEAESANASRSNVCHFAVSNTAYPAVIEQHLTPARALDRPTAADETPNAASSTNKDLNKDNNHHHYASLGETPAFLTVMASPMGKLLANDSLPETEVKRLFVSEKSARNIIIDAVKVERKFLSTSYQKEKAMCAAVIVPEADLRRSIVGEQMISLQASARWFVSEMAMLDEENRKNADEPAQPEVPTDAKSLGWDDNDDGFESLDDAQTDDAEKKNVARSDAAAPISTSAAPNGGGLVLPPMLSMPTLPPMPTVAAAPPSNEAKSAWDDWS